MSEFTFNCPHCKQSVKAPEELLGQTINCPSCKQQFALPMAQVQAAEPLPVLAATGTADNTYRQIQTSPTAIWSLVLGIFGVFTLLTAIPAIICGHIALSAIKRSVGRLTGRGMAIAGLVLGYVWFVIVLTIVILTAVVVPRLGGRVGQSQVSAAKSSIASISLALDLYETDNGFYPSSLQALLTKGGEPNWRGPYSKKNEMPRDPWGREFVYTVREDGYVLKSYGPDGSDGGGDDVTN